MATVYRVLSGAAFGLLLLLCIVVEVSGRGGRGGGARGGGARGGSRGGIRGGSRGGSSSSIRGGRYGGFGWKSAAAAGYIYGYTSYSRRRMYTSHPNSEPSICTNKYDYSRSNGTHYTYFICPMAAQPEDYTYCCGETNREKCCAFGDSPGRVAGVVIGVLIGVAIIATCAYCCCCRNKKEPKDGQILSTSTTYTKGAPMYPMATAGAVPTPATGPMAAYPQNPPPQPGPPGFDMQPGPGFDQQSNYPPNYGVQPAGMAYPPPAAPPAYPPAPPPAYPPNDPNNPIGGGAPFYTDPAPYPTGNAPYPSQPPPPPPGAAYPPEPVPYNIPPNQASAFPSAPPPNYHSLN